MQGVITELAVYGPVAIFGGVLLWINYRHQEQMAKRLARQESQMLATAEKMTSAVFMMAMAVKAIANSPEVDALVERAVKEYQRDSQAKNGARFRGEDDGL